MVHSKIKYFLISHAATAFALGIHTVLISWLGLSLLNLSASGLGWLHAASLFPAVFLLISGVASDRTQPQKILSFAYSLQALAYLILGAILITEKLSFSLLLAYGFVVGSSSALIQPAREKMISGIEGLQAQKRFSYASMVQFSFQSLGILVVSVADQVGFHYAVFAQLFAILIALFTISNVESGENAQAEHQQNQTLTRTAIYNDLVAGVRSVIADKPILHLMVLIGFNGYMHMGVFLVAVPYIAKNFYFFNATQFALLQLMFVVGMVAAHFHLSRMKTVAYPGQGALFSLLYTALIGFAIAKGPTVTGLFLLIFSWGFVAGNSAARCRLVVQAAVPASFKGRVMSIYQLVLFGFAPLGALVTGYFLNHLTPGEIFHVMSGSSVALFVLFVFSKALWKVKQPDERETTE